MSPSQRRAIEDLRLVNFIDRDGVSGVIGTHTASDGKAVRQEILRRVDLRSGEMQPLLGAMIGYKGQCYSRGASTIRLSCSIVRTESIFGCRARKISILGKPERRSWCLNTLQNSCN